MVAPCWLQMASCCLLTISSCTKAPFDSCDAVQPCLGGSGKTLMIVNINPDPASHQETLCALRFAAKVNACETRAAGGAQRHVTAAAADKEQRAPTTQVI